MDSDVMEIDQSNSTWMDPIKEFIQGNVLVDRTEVKKLVWKAVQYIVRDGKLYKRASRCLDVWIQKKPNMS